MKKRVYFSLGAIVVTSAVFVAWIVKNDAAKRDDGRFDTENRKAAVSNGNDPELDPAESARAALLMEHLKNAASSDQMEPGSSSDDPPEITEEEKQRLLKRMDRIQPVYWQSAPSILDDMMKEESSNPAWTGTTEKKLESFLSQEALSGTRLTSTECRETLCKLVLLHDTPKSYELFRTKSTEESLLSGNVHGSKEDLSNGEIQTKVYFSKGDDASPFEEMKDRMLAMVEASESTL